MEGKDKEQNDSMASEMIKRTFRHPGSKELYIKRVPEETVNLFKEIANSDKFIGDYGFALQYLLDFYVKQAEREQEIISYLEDLNKRLCALESAPVEKKNIKRFKRLSGKVTTLETKE